MIVAIATLHSALLCQIQNDEAMTCACSSADSAIDDGGLYRQRECQEWKLTEGKERARTQVQRKQSSSAHQNCICIGIRGVCSRSVFLLDLM